MAELASDPDLSVRLDGYVATVEVCRPPHNFFDAALIRSLADALESLDRETDCRAVVLCSAGKSFCAGAKLEGDAADPTQPPATPRARGSGHLYQEAVRLFDGELPLVAALQGAAVGGGLGLALAADFRVACPEARFSANFARLGFHHGFGLSVTLPRLVGQQTALELLYTGRRVKGEEALGLGLCDRLVPLTAVREAAGELATEIARSAPLAVRSIRRTMRSGLAEAVRAATDHELVEQSWLRQTDDFREGVRAMSERRLPEFHGR
jgi:enoyl-CoA hydratase/carnithine racemase